MCNLCFGAMSLRSGGVFAGRRGRLPRKRMKHMVIASIAPTPDPFSTHYLIRSSIGPGMRSPDPKGINTRLIRRT